MRYLVGLCLLIAGFAVNAQSLRVSVLEKDGRQPVFLAYVNVYGMNHALLSTVQTDEMGWANVTLSSYPSTVEVVASGYESYAKEYSTAPINNNLTIKLVKKFASLNEVVVTGLSQGERLKDALSNYQVVTKATIQAMGAVTLNDALKNQLNVKLNYDPILGSGINMQGMSGNKVKILLDGIPLNGREDGNINLGQINMNNVERIEILQGPMSVVYGTDAVGGVINVITKRENKPFGINLNTYYETVGKYNVDGNVTFKALDRNQFTVGGGRNYFEGGQYIDSVVTYKGYRAPQREVYFKPVEQYIANFAYAYNAPSSFKLNLATDYLDEKITNRGPVRTYDPFAAVAFDEYYKTKRYMNRLSLEGKLGATGRWQSQNGFFVYDRERITVGKNLVTTEEHPTTDTGMQSSSKYSNVFMRSSYSNKAWKLNYTVGYDFNLEYANAQKIAGGRKDIQDYALYANVSAPVIENLLTVQLGGRGSFNTMYNPPIVPSLNLLYTPTEKMQFRGSYTHGYRAPSLKEMYLEFIDNNHNIRGTSFYTDRQLKSENSQHVQLSGSYQFYEKQNNYIQLLITGYYNNVLDGIVLLPVDPDDPSSIVYTYGNLARQRNIIGNAQVDGEFSNVHFQLGYSLNNTFAESTYTAFSASEITSTVQYNWRKPELNFNLFYKYTSPQPRLVSSIEGVATFAGRQGELHTLDGSVDKKFWNRRIHLTVGVKNIFDVRQLTTTGLASTGGAHGGGTGGVSFLPRSVFTTLRFNID